jgi:hypothetical protein
MTSQREIALRQAWNRSLGRQLAMREGKANDAR